MNRTRAGYIMQSQIQVTRSPGIRVVDRGPKWGAKRGYKIPGSGSQPRGPASGTPTQLARQFSAFEFHVRSFTHSEISKLLKCGEHTVGHDIAFEYERRKGIYATGREDFIRRAFHTLETVKQMNFEVLTRNHGESKSGHEFKSIIAATALQARLMGYEAPKKFDARIEGSVEHTVLGLPEVTRQLPDDVATRILYAIAESAGFGGDGRLDSAAGRTEALTIGPAEGALIDVGPARSKHIAKAQSGAIIDVGPEPTGEPQAAD